MPRRIRKTVAKDPSRFFSLQTNPTGASVGNLVYNVKRPFKAVGKYLKENERLNKAASAEYNRRMGGPTSDSPYNMAGIMKIKKELKKKK